jgi:hypothetical protein
MRKFATGVLVSLVFGSQASADYYWVLGSYRDKANALSEQVRLSSVLASEVLVVPSPATDTFRVVTLRENLTDDKRRVAGVQAWLVDITVDLDANQQNEPGVDPGPLPGLSPALPPAKAGETLYAWCARAAPRPAYCDPAELTALEAKRKILARYQMELLQRCGDVTDDRDREICRKWTDTRTVVVTDTGETGVTSAP